jgi:hypothetical protein
MIHFSASIPLAASAHSWDFLLMLVMELALPLLREARRLEHRG